MEADCAAARESLENTEANAAQLERRIDEIYAQSQSFTAEIERIRERVAALQEQAQEKEGNLSLLRSEIEHGQRLAARLQEDMRQDGEKLQDFDSQIEDQRARIDGNRTQISVLTAEAQALAESGVSIEAAEGGKRAQLDQLNRSVMELNGEVTELKLKIGYADNSISVQSENRSRLEEQARASAAATAQLSENAAQLEREGAELEERIQSAANVISGYRLRMQQAKDRLDAETEKRGALERAIAQKTLAPADACGICRPISKAITAASGASCRRARVACCAAWKALCPSSSARRIVTPSQSRPRLAAKSRI